ncbi:hypothetical protein BG004_003223 [Podila humilis]|nr:hypothetical protein BG004_003223 [Podila humilis]
MIVNTVAETKPIVILEKASHIDNPPTRPSSQGEEMGRPMVAQNSSRKRSMDNARTVMPMDSIMEQPLREPTDIEERVVVSPPCQKSQESRKTIEAAAIEATALTTATEARTTQITHHAILAPALNLVPAISESASPSSTLAHDLHELEKEKEEQLKECHRSSSVHSEQLRPQQRDNQSTFSIHEEDDNEEDSEVAMAMSIVSHAQHSKSPPVSSSSASTTEEGPKKSSMILHTGSLSPAWSLNSMPRDISAAYKIQFLALEPGLDEKLFGLVDRYGFLVEDGRRPTAEKNSQISSTSSTAVPTSETLSQAKLADKEQERSLKWAKMAKRTYMITSKSAKSNPTLRQLFQELCATSSPEEEQIDLDIPRTMHGHIMFKERYGPGQCALFNILKAYSNYNRQVGYCQGMASIVATMLTFFDQERYNIHSLVIPGFPALFEAFHIQEGLTKKYAPKVFKALETMGIATPSYASRWYITLYSAGVVPYRTLLRIWDIFLLEGFEWLYFMALALLKYHEAALLQNNFEQTMEMLNAKMNIQDDDQLIKIAQKYHKRARRSRIVVQLRKDYQALQST